MHTPTLLTMLTVLLGIMSLGLFVAWRFNPWIPGFNKWVLSYVFAFLSSLALSLGSTWLTDVQLSFSSNFFITLMAFYVFVGAREYIGHGPLPRWLLPFILLVLAANVIFFTLIAFNPGFRVVTPSLITGLLFISAAWTIAVGGRTSYPARYVFAAATGFHGLFVIGRLWFVYAGNSLALTPSNLSGIPAIVLMENTTFLVLVAFGNMMLVNERINSELRYVAERDSLTGVLNRRSFLSAFNKQISVSDRHHAPLSVLLIDLDHFKKINDTWGHRVGDEVLCKFTDIARACLRDEDVLGRIGGEEFAAVLPEATLDDAKQIAERLRLEVSEKMSKTEENPVGLTVSIGVARLIHGESSEMLMHRADQAMYLAKSTGRNRVEAYLLT